MPIVPLIMNDWKSNLDIFACPITKEKLVSLDVEEVKAINEKVSLGLLKNQSGHPIKRQMKNILKAHKSSLYFPIFDNIPYLSEEESFTI